MSKQIKQKTSEKQEEPEKQIDQMVYKLYNLTEEEVEVVENK